MTASNMRAKATVAAALLAATAPTSAPRKPTRSPQHVQRGREGAS
jgi:hypothetical protein